MWQHTSVGLCFLGEDLELECITVGANPPAKLRWFLGEQVTISSTYYEHLFRTNAVSAAFL